MALAAERFHKLIQKLRTKLSEAAGSDDPAQAVYQSGVRTEAFYLEALFRIYRHIYNKKFFEQYYDSFKALEDILGEIDYHDSFCKEFGQKKTFPRDLLKFFKDGRANGLEKLDALLRYENWLDTSEGMLAKVEADLKTVKWLDDEEDAKRVSIEIADELKRLVDQVAGDELVFEEIENSIHEVRRKLRWVSIYAQAMDGLIQMKKGTKKDEKLAALITPEIEQSPYNSLPPIPQGVKPVHIDQTHFLVLSRIISDLGKIKDEGLRTLALSDSIREVRKIKGNHSLEMAYNIRGKDARRLSELLKSGEKLVKHFLFELKVPDQIRKSLEK